MTKLFILFICLSSLIFVVQAQENIRYLDEIFTNVKLTSDVVYGVNATVLYLYFEEEAVPIPLTMDVYEPEGDTLAERPLVLLFHSGNFLPNVINGRIIGTKSDSSVVEICTRLAKRGYVAASVTYRNGWNPLAWSQLERTMGLIQAIFRGIQDGRTAIRYFRKTTVEDGNPFRIDRERITVFGIEAGGFLVLGMTGLSDYNEILTTTHDPGKLLLDIDGDGIPETPMIVEVYHGDINGENLTITPDEAFGFPSGDTTNYSNHAGYSSDFNLSINISGGIVDISWLSDNTIPTISIQSINDFYVPYGDQPIFVPNGDAILRVQGAQLIGAAQQENGANSVWNNAVFNDPYTMKAIENAAVAEHPYYEGVFPIVKPPNSIDWDEGVAIDWWDPDALSPEDGQGMGIPWNELPHPFGGTYHEYELLLNENMSAEKARANIDTIFGYITPRMCVALDLPCANNFVSSTQNILENIPIQVVPNPAKDLIRINTGDKTVEEVQLFDINGHLLHTFNGIHHTEFELLRNKLVAGMYMVKLRFEDGMATVRVVFR